jgi:hypothetical protein
MKEVCSLVESKAVAERDEPEENYEGETCLGVITGR